jgi:hypothetical protein
LTTARRPPFRKRFPGNEVPKLTEALRIVDRRKRSLFEEPVGLAVAIFIVFWWKALVVDLHMP